MLRNCLFSVLFYFLYLYQYTSYQMAIEYDLLISHYINSRGKKKMQFSLPFFF